MKNKNKNKLRKLQVEGNFFDVIKGIYEKSTVTISLTNEKMK